MIIESISMKNFQCYYGEHERNTVNFKEGLNLIIGHNGGGKSKFFDAFYWVLHDEVFETNAKEFLSTKIYKEGLTSNKAKNEAKIGDTVATEVILVTKSSLSNKRFKLTRIYKSLKVDERDWQGTPSRLLIEEFRSARWHSVEEAKHDSIMRLVIPSHLKPYMWFQGEQVGDLMDFTNKASLTKAINLLSNIKVYDDFITISEKVSNKADIEFRKAQNKLTKNKKEFEKTKSELDTLKSSSSILKKNIDDNRESLQVAQEKIDGLFGQIDDAKEQTKLKESSKRIKLERDEYIRQLDIKTKGLNKKLFEDHWVLMHSNKYINKYTKKYENYFKDHQEQELIANKKLVPGLDINTPQPNQIRSMLNDEKCYVCNREAKEGSDAYHFIKDLLNRSDDVDDVFTQNCSLYFKGLYENSLGFNKIIKTTKTRIKNELKDIENLKNEISKRNRQLDDITDSFVGLIEDDTSESILYEYKTHEQKKDQLSSLLSNDENKLKRCLERQEELEDLLDSLVDGDLDESIVNAQQVFNNLRDLSSITREKVFHDLIKSIEERANTLFSKMAKNNNAITGKINFKKVSNSKYIPEIIGSDGYKLSSPNDSNIILVKLALLMSILLSHGKSSDNYTMILDAPTTKMDFEYSYGFYETLSNCFNQSIVMTFDFRSEEQREKLKKYNIGSIHTIQSNIPNHDDSDLNSLETIIKEVAL